MGMKQLYLRPVLIFFLATGAFTDVERKRRFPKGRRPAESVCTREKKQTFLLSPI